MIIIVMRCLNITNINPINLILIPTPLIPPQINIKKRILMLINRITRRYPSKQLNPLLIKRLNRAPNHFQTFQTAIGLLDGI